MLRKAMLAMVAVASVAALSLNTASAREGGGFSRGAGGGGGGMSVGHGSFGGGSMAMGGRNAASFASTGGGTNFGGGVRSAPIGNNFVRNGSMPSNNWSGGHHHHHGGRGFIGLGLYGGIVPGVSYCNLYDNCYPGYAYYDGDTYDDGCYLVRRRVHTPYGWRVRNVQVCS